MGESAYSYSLTTFSPQGKLVQLEYALSAVTKAPTSLGIKGAFSPACPHANFARWCPDA
jgi:20S proteasome subunit alpha 2